jgi:hypothetical protein
MAVGFNVIALFVLSCIANLLGASLIPASRGLTFLPATLAIVVCYAIGVWSLSRLFVGGANLSLLIPMMSVVIPLCAVFIGVVVYHEAASAPRIALLVIACVLVSVASRL